MLTITIVTALVALGALLIVFRKLGQGTLRKLGPATSLVGSFGTLKTDLEPGLLGKVEIHGTLWNAEAFESLAQGTRVVVIAQDNLTITVSNIF